MSIEKIEPLLPADNGNNNNNGGDGGDKSTNILYDDGCISLTATHLTLRRWWFPFGFKKVIPLVRIAEVRAEYPRSLFFMKSWGMGVDFQVWWHCQMFRGCHGRNALVLSYGEHPWAGITPGYGRLEDAQLVESHLRSLCPNAVFHGGSPSAAPALASSSSA